MTSESLILIRKLHERAKLFAFLDHDLTDQAEHVVLARKFYSLVEEAYQISIKLNAWSDDPLRRIRYSTSLPVVTTGRKDGSGNREE